MPAFTFIDLFAGIGGFRLALDRLGGRCLHFSEINRDAIATYCTNFKESAEANLGDITRIGQLPPHDLLVGGVPCQSWSIAGKNLGFADDRGELWNDAISLLQQAKPKAFLFENVKGLADPRNAEALTYILERIRAAGYFAEYFVVNSADYGVPQHRIRIYIVGFQKREHLLAFRLPKPMPLNSRLGDVLQTPTFLKGRGIQFDLFGQPLVEQSRGLAATNGENDYFLFNDLRGGPTTVHSWDIMPTTARQKSICLLLLKNRRKKQYGPLDGNPLSLRHLQALDKSIGYADLDELVATKILKTVVAGDEVRYEFKNGKISTGLNGVNRIFLPGAAVFPTLTASDARDFITTQSLVSKNALDRKEEFIETVYKPGLYRKLTKQECCQMQGFPVGFHLPENRAKWMKLLGNSVSVPVIEQIGLAMVQTGVFGLAPARFAGVRPVGVSAS